MSEWKVTASHRSRAAVIYVRQSTLVQVERNRESTARQYDLVSRARDMLWANRFRWNRCTTGDTRAGRQLWVYGRAGQTCRRCGARIKCDDTGERVAYWCPTCQR